MVVAAASIPAFFGTYYSEHIPAAAQSVIDLSRSMGRQQEGVTRAYYSRCDDARAAGVAPLYAGEPGYRAGLDRDGDGVACEPYMGG